MKKINIAIVGLGQVGRALVRKITPDMPIQLIAVCDKEPRKTSQYGDVEFTFDYKEVLGAENVDVVVECIGGTSTAYDVVSGALASGKDVVTSNTALMATQGHRLMKRASASALHLKFEAALHGDGAWARTMAHGRSFSDVQQVYGVFSSCANYVLMRMRELGETVEKAYSAACEFGLGCGDMQYDLGGREALYRTTILRALTFDVWPEREASKAQGIQNVEPEDLTLSAKLGYRMKLLGSASYEEQEVAPYLVEEGSYLSHCHGQTMGLAYDSSNGGSFVSAVDKGIETAVNGIMSDLLAIAYKEKPHEILTEMRKNAYKREQQNYFVRSPMNKWDSSMLPHTMEVVKEVSNKDWTGAIVKTRLKEKELSGFFGEGTKVYKVWGEVSS